MSMRVFKQLVLPLTACVLTLPSFACGEEAKASVHSSSAPSKAEAKDNETDGACSERDRTDYIHDPNPRFIKQLRECSNDTWANKGKNTACLKKAMPTLSGECAGCFAQMASCSLSNCKAACVLSSTSDGCNECANSHCQSALVKCTGVVRADLP